MTTTWLENNQDDLLDDAILDDIIGSGREVQPEAVRCQSASCGKLHSASTAQAKNAN